MHTLGKEISENACLHLKSSEKSLWPRRPRSKKYCIHAVLRRSPVFQRSVFQNSKCVCSRDARSNGQLGKSTSTHPFFLVYKPLRVDKSKKCQTNARNVSLRTNLYRCRSGVSGIWLGCSHSKAERYDEMADYMKLGGGWQCLYIYTVCLCAPSWEWLHCPN